MEQQKQTQVGKDRVKQVSYADDLAAGGKLENIKIWWDLLTNLGPKIGYFPNSSKSWLIVVISDLLWLVRHNNSRSS